MTSIGSTLYSPTSRYNATASLESSRRAVGEAISISSTGSPVDEGAQSAASQSTESLEHDDADTFLYDRNGQPASSSPTVPTGPIGRFASIHEENLFLRDASKEELAEVYGTTFAELMIRGREGLPQAIANSEQVLAKAKRENPTFVANTLKNQARETVGQIQDNLKRVASIRPHTLRL